jgi:hypothetical protein
MNRDSDPDDQRPEKDCASENHAQAHAQWRPIFVSDAVFGSVEAILVGAAF